MKFTVQCLGAALVLVTLPGSIELSLLTVAELIRRRRIGLLEHTESEKPAEQTATFEKNRIRRLAVLVPAHNEATTISRCIDSLARCERPPAPATAHHPDAGGAPAIGGCPPVHSLL